MNITKLPISQLLHGLWRFKLDPSDLGVTQEWFNAKLSDNITLPGTLQEQGYGEEVSINTEWVSSLHDPNWYLREEYSNYTDPDNFKVPFFLQPKKYYRGAAWYQRDIVIPEEWRGLRTVLTLERANWETKVWLNDTDVGSNNSLSTPHQYDLGVITPGKHTITIKVDNRMIFKVRPDAHSISDSVGNTWNGIIGNIDLSATSPVWIDSAEVYPDIHKKSILIKTYIGNVTEREGIGELSCGNTNVKVEWDEFGGYAELNVQLDKSVGFWDEFNPELISLELKLSGSGILDIQKLTFGLRQLKSQGTQFILNDKPIHFRGTHDAAAFPITGYTAMDVESWRRIFLVCQEQGLNHVRYHSFCPPKAAFVAADELGFYLQVECGIWTQLYPESDMEKWLYEETERILQAYGNHPSFMLLSHGNEPSGRWQDVLPKWVKHFKGRDSRRLYCMQSGRQVRLDGDADYYDYWNNISPEQEFLVMARLGPDQLRGPSVWNGKDFRNVIQKLSVPTITHEVGQWCSFPNIEDAKKYTGHLQGKNYEIYRDSLEANGLLEQAHDFFMASGKFQTLCYKAEIEANMRTPNIGGIQLLDLHDYPGQGTSYIGVLDVFWDAKEYVTSEEFRRFCNTTVPLARFESQIFKSGNRIEIPIEMYHYGKQPLKNKDIIWKVIDQSETVVAKGEFTNQTIPLGSGIPIGKVSLHFNDWDAPAQYKLVVSIKDTTFINDWNFWVYPESNNVIDSNEVLVTNKFNDDTIAKLNKGENVLFFAGDQLSWEHPPFAYHPIFWNRLMNPKWSRSLGILCSPDHPAFGDFPTDYYANAQWGTILDNQCRAIDLNLIHKDLKPIVQGIDDWNRNLKLGLIFECRIGNGKMLVCSADLYSNLDKRPSAKQLYQSLLHYMQSDKFNPDVTLEVESITRNLFSSSIMRDLGAKITTDIESDQFKAENIIDGDPNSLWLTSIKGEGKAHPHHFIIEFEEKVPISGAIVMQSQHDFPRKGHIKDYQIQISDDGKTWVNIISGSFKSTFKVQKISFDKIVSTKYLKFVSLSSFADGADSSLAEFAVIYEGEMHNNFISSPTISYIGIKSGSEDVDDPTADI